MNQRQPLPIVVVIVLLVFSPPAIAQEGVQQAQEQLRLANVAREARNYGAQVEHLEKALVLNPASLRTRYNLARAYALHGQEMRALETLGELVDLGVDYGMSDDADLASLASTPAFETMLERLEKKVEPVIESRRVATIEEFGLVPEGIAHDRTTGRTFFGSMRNGGIYVLDATGGLSRFASLDLAGFSAIGLAVDERRRRLWVIGTATELAAAETETPTESMSEMETPTESTPTERTEDDSGTATNDANDFGTATNDGSGADMENGPGAPEPAPRTGVFGFDLESGTPSGRFLAEPSVEGFNDVAVAPSGDLYLSGSRLSVVSPESGQLRPLSVSPVLVGTNGIVVSADGSKLFTSVYPVGIATVDLSSGRADFLELPDDTTLYGIDGLYLHENDLIAVQNGTEPWRLLRIELDDRQRAVTVIRVLERANPEVTPTTGAIAGDEIILVGQGPAPAPPPSHVPESLVPFFGQTLIMAAPLD